MTPNPSLEWTATGKPLGPRASQCHHPSRGPSAFPASAPQLKREAAAGSAGGKPAFPRGHGPRSHGFESRSLPSLLHALVRFACAVRLACQCSAQALPFRHQESVPVQQPGACFQALRSVSRRLLPACVFVFWLRACCLTGRSSGPPPAWHLAREALTVIIRLAGQAPSRRRPLSSNVRPHSPPHLCYVVSPVRRAVRSWLLDSHPKGR